MSSLSITLPESIRDKLEDMAREEGVTVDAFISSVLTRRVAYAEADSYVRMRARRGSRERLLELLAQAPDVEPEPYDRLLPSSEGAPPHCSTEKGEEPPKRPPL